MIQQPTHNKDWQIRRTNFMTKNNQKTKNKIKTLKTSLETSRDQDSSLENHTGMFKTDNLLSRYPFAGY